LTLPVDLKELKKLAKNKLSMCNLMMMMMMMMMMVMMMMMMMMTMMVLILQAINGKNFYLADGTEVVNGTNVLEDAIIYVCCGEGFTGGIIIILTSIHVQAIVISNIF
jgi:hypothetical protein